MLGGRPMVGLQTLDLAIGVRVPASQPRFLLRSLALNLLRFQIVNQSRRLVVVAAIISVSSSFALAQKVVRVSDPDAINPAEVSIAINPKNPDNIVGASFQAGRPPRPRYASYFYVSMDGGKSWKTVPVEDPKGLTQGDDAIYFSSSGIAY